MINQLFSVPIWHSKCDMDDLVKESLYYQILSDPAKNNHGWECNVDTSYSLNSNNDNINYHNACLYYKKAYEDFASCLNYNLGEHTYDISRIWYNKYTKKQYQEQHNHLPSTFSGIHYLKLEEGHTNTIFFNPSKYEYLYEDYARELYDICDSNNMMHSFVYSRWSFPVTEGDIIIFPSSIEHAVFPQKIDAERITVSFNIDAHLKK